MTSQIVDYLIGSGGAAGLTLLLILTGVLVPSAYHKRVVADNNRLRGINDTLTESLKTSQGIVDKLTTSSDLINKLVAALMEITGRDPPRGRTVKHRPDPP